MLLLLNPYVDLILALALAWLSVKIVQALFGPLTGLAVVGSAIRSLEKVIAQSVADACGSIAHGVDNAVGTSLHAVARFVGRWGKTIGNAAAALYLAGSLLEAIYGAYHGLRSLTHFATRVLHGIEHGVRSLTRDFHGIEHELHALEHAVAVGIGNDVLPRIRSLDRELSKVEHKVIPAIEGEISAVEGEVTALGEYVRANFVSVAKDALMAAVLTALGYLGLGGLNCSTLKNALGKRGCGLWSGLEDLLGLFVDTILLTNICELLPLMETAVSDVADPIVVALTDVGAGLCSGGIGAPPALQVPALSLPANPGVTLNLP